MADYVLSAKGTYDGSDFDSGVSGSQSKLNGFMEQAKSVGSKVKSAIGDGFVKTADVITSSVGSIGAAVGTLAVTGGIKRALNIEQAQYKLKQMGMDVDAIMANCSEAVDGTRFGLDAAATSASLLGTSGVAAGEDMTKALKASAGIATIAGGEMEDIASIFSKVATKGKLTGDELLQLNERGINATDALSKALGKSQEEVQDMVKKGQVDFKTFSDAMYSTFGDAAAGANETFSGAMSNVKAALSRVGQKFASPTLDALRQVFVALIPAINAANTALTPLVDAFSSFIEGVVPKVVSGIEAMQSKIEGLGDGGFTNLSMGAKVAAAAIALLSIGSMGGLISQIPVVGAALGGLFGTLGKLATPVGALAKSFGGLSGILGGLSAPVLAVVALVGALIAAFAASMATNKQFRNTIMGLVGDIGSSLAPAFKSLQGLLPALQGLFQSLMNVVQKLAPAVLGLVAAIAPVVSTIVSSAVPVINTLMGILGSLLKQITGFVVPIINRVTSTVQANMPKIQSIIQTAMSAINTLIQTVWPHVQKIITTVLNAVLGVVRAVWPVIEAVIRTAMNVIQGVISAVSAAINGNWDGFWKAMQNLASSAWSGINSIISAAIGAIQSLVSGFVGAVGGFFSGLWESVKSTVSSMWSDAVSAFSKGVKNVMSTIASLQEQIMSVFADAGSWLLNAGGDIVLGLVNGIKNAIGSAVSAAADLGNAAINAAKNALGIHSPSRVFRDEVGKYIAIGIAVGISKNTAYATKAIENACVKLKSKALGAVKKNNYDEVGKSVSESFANSISKYAAKAEKAVAKLVNNQVASYKKTVNGSAKGQIAALKSRAKSATMERDFIESTAKSKIEALDKLKEANYEAQKAVKADAKKEIAALDQNAKGFSKQRSAINAAAREKIEGLKEEARGYTKEQANIKKTSKERIAALDKSVKAISKKQADVKKKAEKDIASFAKKSEKVSESYAKAMDKASAKVQARFEQQMASLSEAIQDKYDTIASLQEGMRSKLVDYSSLYDSDAGAETLADLKADLKAIQVYGKNMEKLKGAVSEDLLSKVAEMDVKDATAYSSYLLGLSKTKLAEYDRAYSQIVSKANSVSKNFYAERVKEVKAEYEEGVRKIFDKAQSDLESAGINALKGFVNGISKSSKSVDKAVSKLASSMVKTFKKKLGIKSPSRVLRDQVGKFIPLGVAAGIDKAASNATKSVMRMTGDIIAASESALGASDRNFASAYEAALNMGELEVSYNTDAKVNGASGTESEVAALRAEVMSLRDSLGQIIAENAPVVTETERQAARRYRRAQYAW